MLFNNNFRLTIFIGLIIVAIFSNFLLLDTYHQWGDDFSLYLNQGEAMVNGKYTELFIVNKDMVQNYKSGPILYPIGFPIVISPIFKFFEFNFIYFKYLSFLIFLIGLFVFHKINTLLKVSSFVSLTSILLVLMCPIFIWQNNNIGSDILSFTLCLTSIYFYLKIINDPKNNYFYLFSLSFFVGFSIFTRSINIILLFSIIMFLFWFFYIKLKNFKRFVICTIVISFFTIFLFLLNIFLLLNRDENVMQTFLETDFIKTFSDNIYYYSELITSPFLNKKSHLISSLLDYTPLFKFRSSGHFISVLLIFMVFISMIIYSIKKYGIPNANILFISFFLLGNISFYLIFPYQQGTRFILIIYPFLFVFILSFFNSLLVKFKFIIIFLFSVLVCLEGVETYKINLFQYRNENIKLCEELSIPGTKHFNSMTDYIRDSINIDSDKAIGFCKPRLLRFFTNQKSYLTIDENKGIFQYILVCNGFEDDFYKTNRGNYIFIKNCGRLELYKSKISF